LAAKNQAISDLLAAREKDQALLAKFNDALRDAAHDLQHPMAIVRIHANVLIEMPEQDLLDSVKRQDAAQKLAEAMEEMADMIDATIHSAQVVTGIIKPDARVVDVDALLQKFQSLWFNGSNRQGLDFFLVLPRQRAHLYCPFDLMILKRILRNLIANAIQHSPPGAGVLVVLRRVGNQCLVQVRDSGPGIVEGMGEDKVANFAAFAQRIRREGSQVKQSGQASGYRLGMGNVLQLCIATGLQMQLCAKPGLGSMFSFLLPLANAEDFIETRKIQLTQEAEWAEIRGLMTARGDLPMPVGDFFPPTDISAVEEQASQVATI
ncbi:MAG: HAMP domain-containing histidine kinase, partial [Candidatus Doudnabacteria bacterium]|nr:HAMP domain-containing histidine kinase [Candidatus Doudnabacteria bacterium]